MNTEKVIKNLCDLTQLDIDAVHAYEQALKEIKKNEIFINIKKFQEDHARHINELSAVIVSLNGEPPKRTQDFKGYLIEGFTSLRSITGTEGALKAMQTNEKLTNATYEKALKKLQEDDAMENIKALVSKNYEDEKRHLAYIKNALANETWK